MSTSSDGLREYKSFKDFSYRMKNTESYTDIHVFFEKIVVFVH